jgi:hypothetical protein
MLSAHRDIVFAERRKDVRIIVNVAGQFSMSNRRCPGGARPVFSCRAVHVSNQTIALVSPVEVQIGDQISADIEHLGKFDGTVARILNGGFVMRTASDEERDKLDDKIDWLERYKNLDTSDQRAHPRFAPAKRRTKMVFADGTTLYCLIRDVSVSGAAVSSDTTGNRHGARDRHNRQPRGASLQGRVRREVHQAPKRRAPWRHGAPRLKACTHKLLAGSNFPNKQGSIRFGA